MILILIAPDALQPVGKSADNLVMARAQLGFVFNDLSGTIGKNVVYRGKSGSVVRRKPTYGYPVHPDMRKSISRLQQSTAAYNELTRNEIESWRRYALKLVKSSTISAREYSPAAKNVFVGLASKVLQVDPAATIPRNPPTGEFIGDSILVSASPGLVFSATGSNSAGVVTELLVQKLLNVRRAPGKFYKSFAFVSFAGAPIEIPVEPGLYALAYRFVEAATGRMSEMQLLGIVESE